MILRIRTDASGRDALAFECVRPSQINAAIAEWQRTGHSLPASLDLWDDNGKWIAISHPENGMAFLRLTGRLDQPARIWDWLVVQDDYTRDMRAITAGAVSAAIPRPQRPKIIWRALDEQSPDQK